MIDFEVRARARAAECTFELFGTTVSVQVDYDKRDAGGRLYYQAVCPSRPDAFTGLPGEGRGGKAYLSPAMLDDELVQLCWGLLDAYVHHEAREGFRWRGRQIYGPHQKIDRLYEIAEDIAVRPPARSAEDAALDAQIDRLHGPGAAAALDAAIADGSVFND